MPGFNSANYICLMKKRKGCSGECIEPKKSRNLKKKTEQVQSRIVSCIDQKGYTKDADYIRDKRESSRQEMVEKLHRRLNA